MDESLAPEKFDAATEKLIKNRLDYYDRYQLRRFDRPNPVYSEAELIAMAELKRIRSQIHWSDFAALLSLVPLIIALVAGPIALYSSADWEKALLHGTICLIFAVFGFTPAYQRYRPGQLGLRKGTSLEVSMSGTLARAWEDWRDSLAITRGPSAGDTHTALLSQDAILHPAFASYLEEHEDLSSKQRREFEDWFLRTCAEGHAIAEAEKELVKLAAIDPELAEEISVKTFPAAIEVALSSPRELEEPLRNASILKEAVTDALARGSADHLSLPEAH